MTASFDSKGNLAPYTARATGHVEYYYYFQFNENGSITHGIQIRRITGSVQLLSLNGSSEVSGSTKPNGTYKSAHRFNFRLIPVIGAKAEETFNVNKTQFWKLRTTVNIVWSNKTSTKTYSLGPVLANKKAIIYPQFKDPYSNKTLRAPSTTTMPVAPKDKRVQWDNNTRAAYIKKYVETYGDPKKKNKNFNWSDYDIHHIIPREYGGTNNFNNLIPLLRSFHQQVVTPWWVNY